MDMGTNLLGDMVKPCQGHILHSQPQVSGQPPPGLPVAPLFLSDRYPPLTQWVFGNCVYRGVVEGAGSLFSQQGEPAH